VSKKQEAAAIALREVRKFSSVAERKFSSSNANQDPERDREAVAFLKTLRTWGRKELRDERVALSSGVTADGSSSEEEV
jgi:hypothetical protein